MKVSERESCKGCPMLKVDYTYEKQGKKIRHLGAEQNFVEPKWGTSLRLSVWEAPGEQEGIQGEPAVGAAGKYGDKLYRKAGVIRDELTIINTIQCRPPNNIYPTDSAARKYISQQEADAVVRQCYREHVRPVLLSRPWTRLDILGSHALKVLTGLSDLFKWRGSPIEVDTDKIDKRMGVNAKV